MISSVSAFGGLSSADISNLFGANLSSSSSSTSASTALSAVPGISVSSVNDPANAIKAILAQAQIEKAQTAPSGSGPAISATVAAAYAAQTGDVGLLSTAGANAGTGQINTLLAQAQAEQEQAVQTVSSNAYIGQLGGLTSFATESDSVSEQAQAAETLADGEGSASATTAYTAQTSRGSVTSFSSESGGMSAWGDPDASGQEQSSQIFSSISATSVSLAPASASSSGSSSNPQAGPVDSFQIALAVDNQSVAFGFSLDGLGQVAPTDATGYYAGQGSLADYFQAEVDVGGHGMTFEFNIRGLDAAQAQQVTAAFKKATTSGGSTSESNNPGNAFNNENQYSVNYGSGLSVSFMDITGYQPSGNGL